MDQHALTEGESLWYRDAVIYQLHVKTYHDSDEDGVGDFKGLTQKLDYLQNLGVTAIWLLPFYPSPLKDDGYDIADYTNVHPAYGKLRDFKLFLREAHRRGLKVITELAVNHTSDQHPWFKNARRAKRGSSRRNFYVWSDTAEKYKEARIILQDFESSNWTWDPVAKAYFWHRFYSHQPDLNYDNPQVHKAVLRALDFWLGMGVDGLRLDAVPYLYQRDKTNCENLPETHAFLKKLRAHVDRKFQNRMLLGNHHRRIELMNGLLFSMAGTPIIYYGDEIGMGDNVFLGDRNGARTPMQWSSDRNAGFSRGNPHRLYLPVITDPEYHFEVVNVEAQENNRHSLLWWMRRLIARRKRFKAFSRGDLEFLHPENPKILPSTRCCQDECILVVANLSRFAQYVELDLATLKNMIPIELFGRTEFPTVTENPYFLTQGPHSFYWFFMQPAAALADGRGPEASTAEL